MRIWGGVPARGNAVQPAMLVLQDSLLGDAQLRNHKQRFSERGKTMDNVTFGVTMMVCGMGGTILTLWIMSLIMRLLGRLFPYRKEEE
jgi:hypothetical protein